MVRENCSFRLTVVGTGMLAPSQERVHIRAYKPSRVKISGSDCFDACIKHVDRLRRCAVRWFAKIVASG